MNIRTPLLLLCLILVCGAVNSQSIKTMRVMTESSTPLPVDPTQSIAEMYNVMDNTELNAVVILGLSESAQAKKVRYKLYNCENQLLSEEEIRLDGKRLPDGVKIEDSYGNYRITLGSYKKLAQLKVELEVLDKSNKVIGKKVHNTVGQARERVIEKMEREHTREKHLEEVEKAKAKREAQEKERKQHTEKSNIPGQDKK